MASGNCYSANGRLMFRKDDSWILCHGVGILQTDGKPFGHCWIEKGSQVYDFSNGKNAVISKSKYYKLGGIPVKGHKNYKYTLDEVRKKIVKTGHWGPWDSNPPR